PAFRLRNLFFPAQQIGTGDIDVVLVGPPGVWVLEVKTYRSAIRVHDRTWERLAGSAWKPLDTDPVRQVRGNARDLRHFLERKPYDVTLHVNAVVVLAHPQRRENIGPADEPIWNYNEVRQNLAALNELDTLLSVKEREAIVAA